MRREVLSAGRRARIGAGAPLAAARAPLSRPSHSPQAVETTRRLGATALEAAATALDSVAPAADAHRAHPAVARLLAACPSPQLDAYVRARRWLPASAGGAAAAVGDAVVAVAEGADAARAAAEAMTDVMLEASPDRLAEAAASAARWLPPGAAAAPAATAALAALADALDATVALRDRVASWLGPGAAPDEVRGVALAWRNAPFVDPADAGAALALARALEERRG